MDSQSCAAITTIWFHNIVTPKRTPFSLAVALLFPPSPQAGPIKPLIYFFSLWIGLFWAFLASGIVLCVACYVCFLLLSLMFSRFIFTTALVSTFSWLNNIPLYGYTTFCFSFIHQLMNICVVSTFLDDALIMLMSIHIHPCLVLELRWKDFSFTTGYDVSNGFFLDAIYQVEEAAF